MIALLLSLALAQHVDHPEEAGPEMEHITHHLDEAAAGIDDMAAKLDELIAIEEQAAEVGPNESPRTDTGHAQEEPTQEEPSADEEDPES